MTFVDNGDANGAELSGDLDGIESKTDRLALSANSFAGAMTRAFTQAASSSTTY